MTESLLRFKKNQKYICFDFETEGLNLKYSRPWSLSFLVAEGNHVKKEYDYFIEWKDLNVSPEAAKQTKFSIEKYNKLKQDKRTVLEAFDKYLYDEDYIVIGHNVLGFDVYIHDILREACDKKTDYSYIRRIVDTNCLAKSIHSKNQLKKDPTEDWMLWQYKLNNYIERGLKTNQQAMLKEHDIPFDPKRLHESLYDVQMTFKLFSKLVWKVDI
jgi:DNA polymerase III alpha subunit (gram-positive type)